MLIVLALLTIGTLVLSLPSVQTSLAKRMTEQLNKDFGTDIRVKQLTASLFTWNTTLKNVYVSDYKKDTLFYINELTTSLISLRKTMDGELEFGDIRLDGLVFKMKTYKGNRDTNLDVFVAQFDEDPSAPAQAKPFFLAASGISLTNGSFIYIDENLEEPHVLDFKNIESEIDQFQVLGPNVDLSIRSLSCYEKRGIPIEKLQSKFSYTKTFMNFENLLVETKVSKIQGDLRFDYDRSDFGDFLNKVKLKAKFQDSKVSFADVNTFYNGFNPKAVAYFDTDVSGTLNQLHLDYIQMDCSNSKINGDFVFYNLFEREHFRMFGGLEDVSTDYYDLVYIMPHILQDNLPPYLKKLQRFTVRGEVDVTEEDLDLNVSVFSNLGSLRTTLKIDKVADLELISYEGYASLIDFDLGSFLGESSLGKVSLDFNVDGNSFLAEYMNMEVNGNVFDLEVQQYHYKNIVVAGVLKEQLFDGNFSVDDPNLKLTFEGLADFSSAKSKFDFQTKVDFADLHKLRLTKDSTSIFKGNINLDVIGSHIDDFEGDIKVFRTSYTNKKTAYYFNDFLIRASQDPTNGERRITINSPDIITGRISGKFKLIELPRLAQNALGSIYVNFEPDPITQGQYVDFNFKIYNKIIEAFYPDITLGKGTSISGKLNADNGDFKINFVSPRFDAFGNKFRKLEFQLDNNNPLYNTYLEIAKIESDLYQVSDLNLINTKLNDTLYFRSEFKGGKNKEDQYNFNLYQTFDANNMSVIGFKRSDLTFKGNTWYINAMEDKKNKLVFNKNLDSIQFNGFSMSHLNERIAFDGVSIKNKRKDLQLRLENISLNKVVPEIDSLKLGGIINGNLNLIQNGKKYLPTTSMQISDLEVNDYDFGNLNFTILGNEDISNFAVNAQLSKLGKEVLSVIGNVKNEDSGTDANLFASFQDFDIAPFSPLGEDVITNIRGKLSGGATLRGPLTDLQTYGTMALNQAGFKIAYTNVDYNLAPFSRIDLEGNELQLKDILVYEDKYNTGANVFGTVSHKGFRDWRLNLNVDSRDKRLMVLNTDFREGEEQPLYGEAFIKGKASIYGPIHGITLKADATSAEGTYIKIPISDVATIGDYSYIQFYDKNRTVDTPLPSSKSSGGGIQMEFDLNILQNAEVEIVVDTENKSTMKGRVDGLLYIGYSPLGDMTIVGDIAIMSGSYNFRYGGLIDKTLSVRPGGSITWEGDPYDATIDLEAVYDLTANPAPILDNPEFTRRIPVKTILSLDGSLKSPVIVFDIEFPGAHSVLRSELDYRLQDKDKKEQQAFSLLYQGVFVNELTITQEAITGNLIQTASGIINQALSNKDEVFNLGLNYEQGYKDPSSDIRTDDRVGFTVSTKLDENVLINGKVGVPVGGVTETVLIGEIEVQVFLNKEKTLSMKVFNRENEIQQYLTEQAGYTQGVGLSYQVEFDTFKGLLQKIFGKKKNLILREVEKDSVIFDTGKKNYIQINEGNTKN
ncbi:MAG: translocation/assembly module TamB [Flavobacteriaceae bacterium]|nr:translocation/assembly module TamB [Flavobacteriaceae bacterium]